MTFPLQGKSQIINTDEVLSLTREGCVQFVDGKPIKRDIHKAIIRGNVQPFGRGFELLMVPEGDRNKEMYWVYTDCEVLINDRITRRGVNFQVQAVEKWGSYRRCQIVRIDIGPNASPGVN